MSNELQKKKSELVGSKAMRHVLGNNHRMKPRTQLSYVYTYYDATTKTLVVKPGRLSLTGGDVDERLGLFIAQMELNRRTMVVPE